MDLARRARLFLRINVSRGGNPSGFPSVASLRVSASIYAVKLISVGTLVEIEFLILSCFVLPVIVIFALASAVGDDYWEHPDGSRSYSREGLFGGQYEEHKK